MLMVSGFLGNFVKACTLDIRAGKLDKRGHITCNREGVAKKKTGVATEYAF